MTAGTENDPLRYTSLNEFKVGSVLHFSYSVYNPRLAADRKPKVIQSYRLYRDGQLVFSSTSQPVPVETMASPIALGVSSGIMLGKDLLPGDYVLQVDVNDELAGRQATQFSQFEIVQ
jgi:hypothetical protein